MDISEILEIINRIAAVILAVLLSGNVVYPFAALVFHRKEGFCGKPSSRRYAVMVCARNEREVIGYLIESIKIQDYPSELIDIYVLADNCTDDTAVVAESCGARVFVRNDRSKVGKGYALNYLYAKIILENGDIYDGFYVFDADNLLSSDYITQMDMSFKGKSTVLTSLRNTKNFADGWISAGYSIGWLLQSGLMNSGRQSLGIPCFVSGTGFLIGSDVLKQMNGWNFFTLTEDCEFTTYCAVNGIEIGVCPTAEFYDEQPSDFRVAWVQRLRWAKGKYQIFGKYWKQVLRGFFSKRFFIFLDSFFNIFTSSLVVLFSSIITVVLLIIESDGPISFVLSVFSVCLKSYLSILFLGILTLFLWWNKIHARTWQKLFLVLFYPLHITLYIPIALVAALKHVEWTPIKHGVSMSVKNFEADRDNFKVE